MPACVTVATSRASKLSCAALVPSTDTFDVLADEALAQELLASSRKGASVVPRWARGPRTELKLMRFSAPPLPALALTTTMCRRRRSW